MANVKALHKRKPVLEGGKLYTGCKATFRGLYTEFRVGSELMLDYGSKSEVWYVELDRKEAQAVIDYLTEALTWEID